MRDKFSDNRVFNNSQKWTQYIEGKWVKTWKTFTTLSAVLTRWIITEQQNNMFFSSDN